MNNSYLQLHFTISSQTKIKSPMSELSSNMQQNKTTFF